MPGGSRGAAHAVRRRRLAIRSCPRTGRGVGLLLAVGLVGAVMVGAVDVVAAAGASPALAETAHFETTKFLIGLRQQGLIDLALAYMDTYPPRGEAEKAWYERERILIEGFRAHAAVDARLEVVRQADGPALRAIRAERASPRSTFWRIDRAQTWFYNACRPLLEQVLFYGRTPNLARDLRDAANATMAAYDEATVGISDYIGNLSSPGNVQRAIRRLNFNALGMLRQLEVEQCWVRMSQAMLLERTDAEQGRQAGKVLETLNDLQLLEPEAPAAERGQALLIAAMAARLQRDWAGAERYLERAVEALADSDSDWIRFTLQVERSRLLLDEGRFADAAKLLESFSRAIQSDANLDPMVKTARELSLAMLQFESLTLVMDEAAAKGDRQAHAAYNKQRFDAVARLALAQPDYRQGIYQMVADRLGDVSSVAGMPPFGKASLATVWTSQGRFEQALPVAEALDRETSLADGVLKRDAIYVLAVCLENLKRTVPAAEAYLRLARSFPQDSLATRAAMVSMSLMMRDRRAIDSPAGRTAFVQAGDVLLRMAPEEVKRRNWLLPLAEAALEDGRYDRAAELFRMVPRDSPMYTYAVTGRIRAVAGRLQHASPAESLASIRREAAAVVTEANGLVEGLRSGSAAGTQPGEDREALIAKLLLAAGRLCVDPLGEPDRALAMLEGMDKQWANRPDMLAGLLNVRIRAFRQKGDVEQAMRTVDQAVAANPDTAGNLIVSLLTQMRQEIEQQRKLGRQADTEQQAADALDLAERLDKWSEEHPDVLKPQQRHAVRVGLARTLQNAGQTKRALTLFDALAREDAGRSGGQTADAAVLEGQADCLFALERWSEARSAYQGIWRRAQVRSSLWWRAILQSLRCSVNLNEDPARLYKVIRQHRELYPDMGGFELSRQFDEISLQLLKKIEASQKGEGQQKAGAGDAAK